MLRTLLELKPRDVPIRVALRNTAAVIVPLGIGIATDQVAAGLGIAAGALNTMFLDQPGPYRLRMQRMLLTANVWRSTSTQSPMQFIADTDAWLRRRAEGWVSQPWGEWTMMGGQMHISPIVSAGTSAYFAYLHRNCIQLASAGSGDVFQADADHFALDERLLKLGMIWQWKQNKGAAYAEDMGTYQDALNNIAGRDSPAPIIIGRQTMSTVAGYSYPWPTPTEPVVPL